mmetsp:Transcript_100265/g.283964  ORF Transcript_100265/g.283964 Transcript_100265/m.283964 type:complete len:464 (+) Transcript_100265:73-1464(+)
MGNSFGGWFEPGAPQKEGTTLIELQIHNIQDAHDIIGERPGDCYTPVTLVPQNSHSSCCCVPLCWVSVPHGFSAIVTRFGAVIDGDEDDGTFSSGCHCMSFLNNVDKLVSKQMIIFDTPVKDCKTKDAITVNIDVMVLFEITKARDFVYSIGPEKFDDLLRASQDEALRQMAMETAVSNIYDLHGTDTDHIIKEMNAKFEQYGVQVHRFTVKNVTIPPEMAADFEDKTLFDSKTTMKHKQQAFDRLKLNNEEGKEKLREECTNAWQAAEQQAEVVKIKVLKETAELISNTGSMLARKEAEQGQAAQQVLADSELQVSEIKSKILVLEREVKSKTQAQAGRLDAESQAYKKKKETDAMFETAQRLASGKTALGEAEGSASEAFAARRAHEAEMKRLDVLEQLVMKQDAMIATTQENTMSLNPDNQVVTQVAQQGLEALRAKLAEITATSVAKLQAARPDQHTMR